MRTLPTFPQTLPTYPQKWRNPTAEAITTAQQRESRFPLLAIAGGLVQSAIGMQFCFAAYVDQGDWLSWLGCGVACGVAAVCVKELVVGVGMTRS